MRVYYGADGIREHLESNNLGVHTRDQGGVYASFDARALQRFSFNVGAREELYTAGRQVFSPSVSGAYWVSSRVKLHASASHAFRLPDFTEFFYNAPGTQGNPNLKPETSWSYEGGVQLALGHGILVDADVFHRRDHNVIDYALSASAAAGTPAVAENLQNLNFTGAELTLRWQLPRRQRIELSYTGIHGYGTALPNVGYRYVFDYPVHQGVATWWSRIPGGFDARFRAAAVQRRQSATDPQGAYALVEWTVEREFRWVKPYLQLTNLTDTRYEEIPGVAMPGRGFIAGMELRWKRR
jgi:iron complex outermembrane receptor protein